MTPVSPTRSRSMSTAGRSRCSTPTPYASVWWPSTSTRLWVGSDSSVRRSASPTPPGGSSDRPPGSGSTPRHSSRNSGSRRPTMNGCEPKASSAGPTTPTPGAGDPDRPARRLLDRRFDVIPSRPAASPVVVGVLYPTQWYGDREAFAAEIDLLGRLDPQVQVLVEPYVEPHELRSARGKPGAEQL